MTTIVLAHPNERCPRFQVFGVYEAPNVHRVFALEQISSRDEAELAAYQMMETYEADHFRRVIEIEQPLGRSLE
ncbi:MAG: hypothetical protein ACLP9L_18395 [Thermoguttaceae bacterium]